MENGLVCVNCGKNIATLYKKYNPTVFKLTECIADKYVEYDGVIILIDLILFNKEAYRHILYNTGFQNHWKLGLIILFLKIFNQWVSETSTLELNQRTIVTESAIYKIASHTIIGCAAYVGLILTLLSLVTYLTSKKPNYLFVLMQWKAIVLSNISQFFLLPSLIWQDLNRETHLIFVIAYSLISQIQALSVVTKSSKMILGGILIAAFSAELFTLEITKLFFT